MSEPVQEGRLHQGSSDPGLFACLYRPPLPGQFIVPPDTADAVDADASADRATRGERWSAAAISPPLTASPPSPTSPLVAIAAEFSPRYEQHRPDLVSIDVRGLSRLLGTPRTIGQELRRESASRGVRVHVAIAPTRMAALVLSLARPGLTVVGTGGVAEALAPISLTVLEQLQEDPQPASGSATQGRVRADEARLAIAALKRWGLRTLGELAALPAADLSARLGRGGRVWQAIARGEDTRPLVPMQAEERFEGTLQLEWPIEGAEPLSFVLTRLLEPLSTRLERRDRGTAVLHVALGLVTREVHACRLELSSPLRDVRALRTLALLDVEAHPPSAAIDRVTVTIEPTPGRILQHALFARPHPTPEQLSTLLARLGALMGQDRIGAPALVDTHRPGAFAMTPFAIEHSMRPDPRSPLPDPRSLIPDPRSPTPDPRSPIPDPRSPIPDPLSVPVSVLRRCRQPVPARVDMDRARRPLRVSTERRGFAGGAVLTCTGPWRTSGAWWECEGTSNVERATQNVGGGRRSERREDSGRAFPAREQFRREEEGRASTMREPLEHEENRLASPTRDRLGREGGAWSRDEWDVALDDGAVYRIFRDRVTDGWFIDGVLD